MFEPEVTRRMQLIQDARATGKPTEANTDADRSNDLMQWLVEQGARSSNAAEMTPKNLSNKLVLFNLFGKREHKSSIAKTDSDYISSNSYPNHLTHNYHHNAPHSQFQRRNPNSAP